MIDDGALRAGWLAAARAEGIPSALAAARDAADALLTDRGLRRTTAASTADSLLAGAVASAALDGSSATVELVRAGSADPTVSVIVSAYSELLSLVPTVVVAPLQVLARVHALVAPASEPAERRGRLRESPGLAERMQALGSVLAEPTDFAALALGALAHATIAAERPFAAANGAVGRAVERLVWVSRGVDPASVLVPEAGHLALSDSYRSAVEALRAAEDPAALAAARLGYLRHSARAVSYAVEASPLAR